MHAHWTGNTIRVLLHACTLPALALAALNVGSADTVPVSDASLSASFYSDSSCLLTIDSFSKAGQTVINADVDDGGSRMLIHCDTSDGRRLTLLARGDALNVSQRVPLLTREEIEEGGLGMIAWLTRSGVQYADDSAPRRYVIAGSVLLRKSPPVDFSSHALHSQRQAFGRISGILEPILKTNSQTIAEPLPQDDEASLKDALLPTGTTGIPDAAIEDGPADRPESEADDAAGTQDQDSDADDAVGTQDQDIDD
ncbi:MAG: hypothetical protein HKN42_00980 [Granulosicoccus sp.]|nr:hypothetical protein [Granulosicoccus sp.]